MLGWSSTIGIGLVCLCYACAYGWTEALACVAEADLYCLAL